MSAPSWRHAFVTGAAGAIGAALAHRLADAAPRIALSLCDLDVDGLESVRASLPASVECSLVPCDLADPGAVDALCAELGADGDLDLLVNCAGIMDLRSLAATPWEDAARLLAVDFTSPLQLMHAAVPGMIERGGGAIVNVSSMAGVTPLRGATYYGAAKAGIAMASEIAALELADACVHVVTVYPGPVRSALEAGARAQLRTSRVASAMPTGDADELARRIVDALVRRRPRVVYPALYAAAFRAPRVAGAITRWLSPPTRE